MTAGRPSGVSHTVSRHDESETLVAAHPGNTSRFRHGVYSSRREVTPEVRELAEEIMQLPHVVETDYAAALEIAKLVLLIDRIDAVLADGRVERRGTLRALVDERRRMSAQPRRHALPWCPKQTARIVKTHTETAVIWLPHEAVTFVDAVAAADQEPQQLVGVSNPRRPAVRLLLHERDPRGFPVAHASTTTIKAARATIAAAGR